MDPTCVLKVHLGCCKACPKKVKQQLMKIDGVYYIDIDFENDLVTIYGVGKEHAAILKKAIKKAGKIAELCVIEENHSSCEEENHSRRKSRDERNLEIAKQNSERQMHPHKHPYPYPYSHPHPYPYPYPPPYYGGSPPPYHGEAPPPPPPHYYYPYPYHHQGWMQPRLTYTHDEQNHYHGPPRPYR